jgi:AcrR family transcriptional regulator
MSQKTKYESRAQVESRLISTTLALLLKYSADQISLREIAEKAQCHHPNITSYFGNKAGLLEAVFPLAVDSIAQLNIPMSFTKPSNELIRLVRLTTWLETNSEDFYDRMTECTIIDVLTGVFVNRFHLNATDAQLSVQRIIAMITTAILYPSVIGLKEEQFAQHFELEMRILKLLGENNED